MKENIQPQHAQLPLWPDKSNSDKQTTLRRLYKDLEVYSHSKAVILPNIEIPTQPPFEDTKDKILDAYTTILGEERGVLLSQLDQIQAFDESENRYIQRTKVLISKNPNILNMNCEVGHVTGSALILDIKSKKILLHKHKKLDVWLQFGGHPDYELSIIEVAKREAAEESSLTDLTLVSPYEDKSLPIDIDLHTIDQKDQRPEHLHADFRYFLATEKPETLAAAAGESDDFWWITPEEGMAPNPKINPAVRRLITKAKIYLDSIQ